MIIKTWDVKNQKPLNGGAYLTARIIKADRSTFWYSSEIGKIYYIHPTKYQHCKQSDGTPGGWYYAIIDYSGSGKILQEGDIIILDKYEIPEELFKI